MNDVIRLQYMKIYPTKMYVYPTATYERIILSSTANATLCLNFNNNFRFRSIHLLFGIDVAKPFSEMPCENQT